MQRNGGPRNSGAPSATSGLRPAIVRPGYDGRSHPDPRADPPTKVIIAGSPETDRFPAVSDTEGIPVIVRDGPDAAPSEGIPLSPILGSLAGFVGWLVAAHLLPPAEVGDAALVVSAFVMVGAAAQLHLGAGILRRLRLAGRRAGRVAWRSLLIVVAVSGLAGLAFALVVPPLATISAGPNGPFAYGVLLFVLAAAGWGLFVMHDVVLVALERRRLAAWRKAVFAVVRIALLVLLAGVLGLGAHGVVVAWVAPIVVWAVVGSAVVDVLAHRAGEHADGGTPPRRAESLAIVGPTAVAQLAGALLYNLVPVVVILRFGPETGAAFFICWQAVVLVEVAAMLFMNSLAGAVAREPGSAAELTAAARRKLLVIFLPPLVVAAALAHPLLLIFGPEYAQSDNVLRLLLLGLAFRLLVVHELGVRRAAGKIMSYARLQLLGTALVLVVAVAAPAVGGGIAALLPAAIGYVAVQVGCAVAALLFPAGFAAPAEERSA